MPDFKPDFKPEPKSRALNQLLLCVTAACVGVIACLYLTPTLANAQRVGPYTLVAHSNVNANVGIFRIDQSSGSVSFCIVDDRSLTTRCGPPSE